MTNFLLLIGGVMFALVLIVASSLLGGVIIQDAWEWFIEPLGAPSISIAHAIGLSMMISYFKIGLARESQSENAGESFAMFGRLILLMLCSWGMMTIVASFM